MAIESLTSDQSSFDLFAGTALTPAFSAPVGLIRIPMKEHPAPADAEPTDDSGAPDKAAKRPGFRFDGDRHLAAGWMGGTRQLISGSCCRAWPPMTAASSTS